MRNAIGFLLLLCSAQGHATTLFDQLRAFNPNWAKYPERLEGFAARPIANDVDYVRVHLAEVLHVLADAPTTHLDEAQRASRHTLIAVLADYARQGRFPINAYKPERVPVFIDGQDTHCAVAFLMRYTGHEDLARRIAAAEDLAWVRDITDPELPAWQAASGFSLEELKLIQGAYDSYLPYAYLLPDKYEVPQKPEQVVRYFEGADKDHVWCSGEGAHGVLNGRWVQNYSRTWPWIVGHYTQGKRSGRWEEYYKGTNELCRTEHWRDDKLNGIRTRYDRAGQVIETILFKNGQAAIKTNFDVEQGLRWVRTPIDTALVHTEVYTADGALLASGNERIHNPDGLLWFQNIELTALNTFAITARDGAPRPENGILLPHVLGEKQHQQQIPGEHRLVQYRKEGPWVYYKDDQNDGTADPSSVPTGILALGYEHFGPALFADLASYDQLARFSTYDSIRVVYQDDQKLDLFGFAQAGPDHLRLSYYTLMITLDGTNYLHLADAAPRIKQIAQLDVHGDLIGDRVDYDRSGRVTRTEHFYVPYKKEDEVDVVSQ